MKTRLKPKPSPYKTTAWKNARKLHIAKQPACVVCGVARKKGMQVHHKVGIGNDPLHTNLATLCYTDHKILELLWRRKDYKKKYLEALWKLLKEKP